MPKGSPGSSDRPKGHRRERLSEAEQAVLINLILRGPDPDEGEPSRLDPARSVPLHRGALRQDHVPAVDVARGAPARPLAPEGPTRPPAEEGQGRPRPSKKGAARGRERSRERSSRSAHHALVHGRGALRAERPDHAPLVGQGTAPARRRDKRFDVRLHLCCGPPDHRGGLRARPALGLHGRNEHLPGRLCRDRARPTPTS